MNKLKMKQTFNKLKFKTIKNSPEILMCAGVVGVIGASVWACKSTLKLTSIISNVKETSEKIHEVVNDETLEYSEEDGKKDLRITYGNAVLDIVKLYTPSVILGSLSIGFMVQSHRILNKRNAALAAAFATATESFNKYRKSVVDRYGERVDYELKHGIRQEKVEVEETDENGKTKKKKISIDVMDAPSDYARYYDESCDGWNKDPEYNLMFLKAQERFANDKLKAQGYLFLNDVYKELGILPSKEGQIVGWVYSPENPDVDSYVDFGIYDVNVNDYRNDMANETIGEERREFVNGYRPSILLDFNVDGNIWEKMGE